jgi:hypothetical protein
VGVVRRAKLSHGVDQRNVTLAVAAVLKDFCGTLLGHSEAKKGGFPQHEPTEEFS